MPETYDAFVALAPIVVLGALIVWAEATRSFLLFLLPVIYAGYVVFTLPADFSGLRVALVGTALLLLLRAVQIEKQDNREDDF